MIVLLDDGRLDRLANSRAAPYEGFAHLSPLLATRIGVLLGEGPALYLETDYFGGRGRQAAALFDGGLVMWTRHVSGPGRTRRSWLSRILDGLAPSRSPINDGLAGLGVVPPRGMDAFDYLGMDRFRSIEDFDVSTD